MSSSNSNKRLILFLTIALALVGCSRKTVFSHYEHVGLSGWEQHDTLYIDITGVPAGTYQEELGLRNSIEYPYLSLTLVADQQSRSGFHRSDTVQVEIADESGKPLGNGISHYSHSISLGQVTLCDSDTVRVRVHHYMLHDDLPGISDIGITLRAL